MTTGEFITGLILLFGSAIFGAFIGYAAAGISIEEMQSCELACLPMAVSQCFTTDTHDKGKFEVVVLCADGELKGVDK